MHARRGGRYVPDDEVDVAAAWAIVVEHCERTSAKDVLQEADQPDSPAGISVEGLEAIAQKVCNWMVRPKTTQPAFVRACAHAVPPCDLVRVFWKASIRDPRELVVLRRRLAVCDAAAWEAALAVGEAMFASADASPTVPAYLFPDTPLWRKLSLDAPDPLLLTCPPTVDEVRAYQREGPSRIPRGLAETLLVEHGAEAIPLLDEWLGGNEKVRKRIATALSWLDHPAAMDSLLRHRQDPGVFSALPKAAKRFPELAIERATARLSEDPSVAELLHGWKQLHGEPPPPTPGEGEVDVSKLHRLFTTPPWTSKADPHTAVALEPDLPPVALKIEGESEEKAKAKVDKELLQEQNKTYSHDPRTGWRYRGIGHYLTIARDGTDPEEVATALKRLGGGYERVIGAFSELETDVAIEIAESGLNGRLELYRMAPVAYPRLAERMLAAASATSTSRDAEEDRQAAAKWMARHPEYAARAWVPVALQRSSQRQRGAVAVLERMQQDPKLKPALQAALTHYGPRAREAVEALLTPDPLRRLPRGHPTRVKFWNPVLLPRPKLAKQDALLPVAMLEVVALVLAITTMDPEYAGFTVLKEELEPRALRDFALALYRQWEHAGEPSDGAWAVSALGLVGRDEAVRAMEERVHRSRAARDRALDVLAQLPTGRSIACLVDMHARGFPGKRRAAGERLQRVVRTTAARWTALPDLGFDTAGRQTMDLGSRTLRLELNDGGELVLCNAKGKPLKRFPRGAKRDDPELVATARERYRSVRAELAKLQKRVAFRFESAMIKGERVELAELVRALSASVLLRAYVRTLVLGSYGPNGGLVASFRLEGAQALDAAGKSVAPPSESLGVVHPIELSASERAAWLDALAGLGQSSLFDQLERPLPQLSEAQAAAELLIPEPELAARPNDLWALEHRGWWVGLWIDEREYELSYDTPHGTVAMRLAEPGLRRGQDRWVPITHVELPGKTLGQAPKPLMTEVLALLDELRR